MGDRGRSIRRIACSRNVASPVAHGVGSYGFGAAHDGALWERLQPRLARRLAYRG